MTPKERQAYMRKWREWRKRKGLCKCGKRARPDRASCAECGANAVLANRLWRDRKAMAGGAE